MNTLRGIPLIFVTLCVISLPEIQAAKANEVEVKDLVKFYVYTRQNRVNPEAIEADVESVVRNIINPSKPTTLAIHGISGNKNAAEYTVIRDTKLALEDGNVIIVDYSALIDPEDYFAAAELAPQIAVVTAELIVLLHESFDLNLQQLHAVGFSLGAHIAGLVGQNVYQQVSAKIKRITGLDPAGIVYTDSTPANLRLSSEDAEFVEVLHTNAGQTGFQTPCGHVDYYPNGGKVQPGCSESNMDCSHNRAVELIPEMWQPLENKELLLQRCYAWEYASLDSCRWLNEKMGDLQLSPSEGIYYVETNAVAPYGKGAFKTEFF